MNRNKTLSGCFYIAADPKSQEAEYCNAQVHRKGYCLEHYHLCYYMPPRHAEPKASHDYPGRGKQA